MQSTILFNIDFGSNILTGRDRPTMSYPKSNLLPAILLSSKIISS